MSPVAAALSAAARGPLQVRLAAAREGEWEGLPVSLTVSVAAEDGRPAGGAAVTLAAPGAWLVAESLPPAAGETVSAPASTLGTARARLLPRAAAGLAPGDQDALAAALLLARPDRELDAAWAELTRRYAAIDATPLRRAVDALAAAVLAADGEPSPASAETSVAVAAWVSGDGNRVEGAAAAEIRFRGWVAPWLRAWIDAASADSRLGDDVAAALAERRDGALLEWLDRRLRAHLAGFRGAAGAYVGHAAAARALQRARASAVAALPPLEAARVIPALEIAAASLARRDLSLLTGMAQVHAWLRPAAVPSPSPETGAGESVP